MSRRDEILLLWTLGTTLTFILAGIFIDIRIGLVNTRDTRFGRIAVNTIIGYCVAAGLTVGSITILFWGRLHFSQNFWYHMFIGLGVLWTLVGFYGLISLMHWRYRP